MTVERGVLVSSLRIVIIGRNEIVREGLRKIFLDQKLDVLAVVPSPEALHQDADLERPIDMFVVDSSSPAEGYGVCRVIRMAFPSAKIVLLGDDVSIKATSYAMSSGADGYLAREISAEPLVCSVRLVASGEKVMPSQLALEGVATNEHGSEENWSPGSGEVRLSNREIEVLQCLTRGDANKEISLALHITEATVKIHIKSIMRKLRVQNRTQAALWAVSRGLALPPCE
jgi:two-component system nitrate/nitrite response regulator NarL